MASPKDSSGFAATREPETESMDTVDSKLKNVSIQPSDQEPKSEAKQETTGPSTSLTQTAGAPKALFRTDIRSGRDLRPGNVYVTTKDNQINFWKVVEISSCKTGKHGAAKALVWSKNLIIADKQMKTTFSGSEDKVDVVLDYGYRYRVIYDYDDLNILVGIADDEVYMAFSEFGKDQQRVSEIFRQFKLLETPLKDEQGSPLCIKYSDVEMEKGVVPFFWDTLYIKADDLPKYGIVDYIE